MGYRQLIQLFKVEAIIFQISFKWLFDGFVIKGGSEGGVKGEVKMRECHSTCRLSRYDVRGDCVY